MNIISKKSLSTSVIKADIERYINSLSNKDEVHNNIPASNIEFIMDLMSGYAAYMNYRLMAEANQTYLTKATRPDAVYKISRAFGYNINRYKAPVIRVRYMDVPTITLTPGQVLGKYGDYDIIYWGVERKYEKLDDIPLVLGKVSDLQIRVPVDMDIIEAEITPQQLEAVDDAYLMVWVDGRSVPITKDVESYVVRNEVVDFSNDRRSTVVSISDRAHGYGVVVANNIYCKWVETDGHISRVMVDDLELDSRFQYLSIVSHGTNGETDDQIKRMAPLFYSTQRRMVSSNDHRFVIDSSPLIKSNWVEVDGGVPLVIKLTLDAPSGPTLYELVLGGGAYSITTDTTEAAVESILFQIRNELDIEVVDHGSDYLVLEFTDTLSEAVYETVGMTEEVIQEWTRPRCCTIVCTYIHENTVDENPVVLTPYELRDLSNWIQTYKMVGYRIIFTPATPVVHEIKLDIGVYDDRDWDDVATEVQRIVKQYNLLVNGRFFYGDLLVQVGSISRLNDHHQCTNLLKYVKPAQDTHDIDLDTGEYLYFNQVTINKVDNGQTLVLST